MGTVEIYEKLMKAFLIGIGFGLYMGLNWDMITDDYVKVYKEKVVEYVNGKLTK